MVVAGLALLTPVASLAPAVAQASPDVTFTFSPSGGPAGTHIIFSGTGCPHDPTRTRDGVFRLPDGPATPFTSDAHGAFRGVYDTTGMGQGQYYTYVDCETTQKTVQGAVYTITGPAAPPEAIVAGSTWYSDGGRAKSGPVGTTISARAVGAVPNVPYRLVLGIGDPTLACTTVVQVLNPTVLYASPSGRIGTTTGTVQAGLPPGTYKLCFEDASPANATGTGGATFTVEG
jgi:hypothetical protein